MSDWQGWKSLIFTWLKKNPGWKTCSLVSSKTGIPIEIIQAIAEGDASMFEVTNNGKSVRLTHEQFAKPTAPTTVSQAADAVLTYANQLKDHVFDVTAVRSCQQVRDRYVHLLELDRQDDDYIIAEDTPAEWKQSNGAVSKGKIVGFHSDDQCCYVALTFPVSESDLPAKIVVDTGFASKQLAQLLASIAHEPDSFRALQVASPPFAHRHSHEVAQWLAKQKPPWSRSLWGPPGSGKTFAIAELCATLLSLDDTQRILFIAPSNVATDTATEQFVEVLRKRGMTRLLKDRRVFRFGYPRLKTVLENSELFGPPELKGLAEGIASLSKRLKRLAPNEHMEAAKLKTEIDLMQKELRDALGCAIGSSQIVFTTITSAVQPDGHIAANRPFDTVIADEASMIGGATLMALTSFAKLRFLLAGDPEQLCPVVKWNQGNAPPQSVQNWLGKDAFQFASGNRVRISEQRRCHPGIWAFVSKLYPETSTAAEAEIRLNQDSGLEPFCESATALVDVSSGKSPYGDPDPSVSDDDLVRTYECACVKSGHSWKNPPTAALSVQLARNFLGQRKGIKVAVITPYRAQARLIRKWLQADRKQGETTGAVEVGTVHSFQGGEADAVILDIADGPPRKKFGALLKGDTARRLLNVAITRARQKLIIVAHKEWVRKQVSEERHLYDVLFSGQMKASRIEVKPASLDDSRKTESPIEERLDDALRAVQQELPPLVLQHRIYDEDEKIVTRADFAFPSIKLAVYCHGAAFHLKPKQWQKDLHQTNELVRLGWKVMAFSGWQINENVSSCVDQIRRTIASMGSAETVGNSES